MSVEGAVDGGAFEAYVAQFLVPELKRGQIVVMDNLSVHKSKRVQRLVEGGRMRALVPATLLSGLQPHRVEFLEG